MGCAALIEVRWLIFCIETAPLGPGIHLAWAAVAIGDAPMTMYISGNQVRIWKEDVGSQRCGKRTK